MRRPRIAAVIASARNTWSWPAWKSNTSFPLSHGGSNDESNLWLACPLCNRYKGNKTEAVDPETGKVVPLFNPRTQVWSEHFHWSEDGLRVIGLTPIGRATVAALHLSDDPDALEARSYWIAAGWHPPED